MDAKVQVRPPAVSGLFYPDEPAALRAAVEGYLDRAAEAAGAIEEPPPKAMIVPHAGYIYSGPVAASAYARLRLFIEPIERVVLIGPAHRLPVRGLAASGAAAFATPLGDMAVDRAAVAGLSKFPQVVIDDRPHRAEHSLEVHLPFLQVIKPGLTIVPLAVGDTGFGEVGEVIDHLWDGRETLIIVSSDLSHYYDYATARRLDAATARAIEALRPEDIGVEQACGRIPVGGLLQVARRRALSARMIDLRNSADVAGIGGEVVGYGSFLLS